VNVPDDPDSIWLNGVRTHNLRRIDVRIPRRKLTVITGVSGSGKSSLAFDTLYAEGRRRFVECLPTYTQQFLERMPRAELDGASRLPPAIAIERAVPAAQARSTVGTTTEIQDYLRLLFARVGRTHCTGCGRVVARESPEDVAEAVVREGGRGLIDFEQEPPRSPRGWAALRDGLLREGFARVWQGGRAVRLEEAPFARERLEVVIDRLAFEPAQRRRIAEAVDTAYRFGHDRCLVRFEDGREQRFSRQLHCAACDRHYLDPEPRMFSASSPLGACPECQGFGRSIQPDLDRIVPDGGLTLAEGPVDPWNKPAYGGAYADLRRAGRKVGLRWNVPYRELPKEHRKLIEEGGGGFYGIRGFFEWLEGRTYKVHVRVFLARYRAYLPCSACGGAKLRPESLAVKIDGRSPAELANLPVKDLLPWVRSLTLTASEQAVAAPVLAELERRLAFLDEVGLGYLTLERPSRTLAGGEAQRIQLARALSSSLVDTLYVLDEPSVGLHPRDVERLLGVLARLRDMGNTVVVVEHDPRVIRRADWLIDLGPGAGAEGGRVVYQGDVNGIRACRESSTGAYLGGRRRVAVTRRAFDPARGRWIELAGASVHNLRDLTVRIPRAALTVVTGVSGSGKSSLIHDTLHGALARALRGAPRDTGPYGSLTGTEGLAGVELVDQSPIGKSPRSNPVTYVKAFDGIRRRLAETPRARARGLRPGYFSFNIPGGRCQVCEGAGSVKVEMHFLPDIQVPCEACGGTRYCAEALGVRDRGRNVAQILDLTVREAARVYADVPEIARPLGVLDAIGVGYLRLGQPAPTLSGGESQRLKLASHLGLRGEGPRVFLLDEPTTGLHLKDVAVLVELLRRLVGAGHTVVVVEHHLDLIAAADWVIDLGPGAGEEGGRLVAQGTPEEVARSEGETGRHLARSLGWVE
jgi:excinuclease ABC subunit A